MNTLDKNEDFKLWRKYTESAGEEKISNLLDPNILAAYIDGSATDSEVNMVEKAMAADPALLQEIIELRTLQAAEPIEIPEAANSNLINSIQSEISEILTSTNTPYANKIRYLDWFQTAAGIAAVLLVSFFGYHLGQETMAMDIQTISAVAGEFAEELNEEKIESEMLKYPNGNTDEEGLS